MTNVTSSQAQEQLSDWTVVDGRLEISVRAKDFVQAIEFVNRFTNLAEAQNHHPDFDIRYNTIRMRVVSHDVGGLTDRDLKFATAVNVLIEEMGSSASPKRSRALQSCWSAPTSRRSNRSGKPSSISKPPRATSICWSTVLTSCRRSDSRNSPEFRAAMTTPSQHRVTCTSRCTCQHRWSKSAGRQPSTQAVGCSAMPMLPIGGNWQMPTVTASSCGQKAS